MLVKKETRSSSILEALPSPHMVAHLLKTSQYDELDKLLDLAQSSIRHIEHHDLLDDILVAARQICVACNILQEEAAWHRWASEEAERREHELTHSLQMIFAVLNGEAVKTQDQPDILTFAAIKPLVPGEKNSLNGNDHNLWQRLQNFLKLEKRPTDDDKARFVTAPPRVEITPESRGMPPTSEAVEAASTYEKIPVRIQETEIPLRDQDKQQGSSSLVIYGLGAFQVYLNDQLIENWPNRKGKSIFKYLIVQRARPVSKEVLMECFWPDSDIEAARNNLNVTIYNLRQALRKDGDACSHILFQDDCYLLNPDLDIWIDFEEFIEHFRKAQQLERDGELARAIHEYGAAESLYQGQLFEEDRYEDWPISQRQNLQDTYLRLLDRLSTYYLDEGIYTACVSVCNKMLAVDSCREDAHRRLMCCYSRQGQHHLALRQYHVCVEAHQKELDTLPSPETVEIYEKIRTNQQL